MPILRFDLGLPVHFVECAVFAEYFDVNFVGDCLGDCDLCGLAWLDCGCFLGGYCAVCWLDVEYLIVYLD